jgi:hypothetical protein
MKTARQPTVAPERTAWGRCQWIYECSLSVCALRSSLQSMVHVCSGTHSFMIPKNVNVSWQTQYIVVWSTTTWPLIPTQCYSYKEYLHTTLYPKSVMIKMMNRIIQWVFIILVKITSILKNMFNICSDMIYTVTDRSTEANRKLVSPSVNKTESLEYTCCPYPFFALLRNTLALKLITAVRNLLLHLI